MCKMHVDSCAASGAARYDYFSGRAIEQQHGTITNIFFVHSPPVSFNLLRVISFSPPISHTCGHHKNHVCVCNTCRRKQVNTHKKTEEGMDDAVRTSSGSVMCIPLEGRLKRRFCFPHQRPHAEGFLSLSPSLCLLESHPPFLSVS